MPPGSSYERQTVKPLAACSAANSRTVLPPLRPGSASKSTPLPRSRSAWAWFEDHVELDAVHDRSLAAHLNALLGDYGELVGLGPLR